MADEKWIAGLRGDLSVREAARIALKQRLDVVKQHMPNAVFHAEDDIEHVHQLRVGTRRAAAALRIFADCLPVRLFKRVRKTLRVIRRSAGEARDWDVFLDMLRARASSMTARQRRGYDFLFGFAHGQRTMAQTHLKLAFDAKADLFAERLDELMSALDAPDDGEPTLSDLARPQLTQLLRDLDTAGRGDLHLYDSLHQVRILGKQLRYAMELFASCYEEGFREAYYPAIVAMQDILGLANDSHVACQRLQALPANLLRSQPRHWPQWREGIEALLAFHERRLPQQRRKFEKWWQGWLKLDAANALAELQRG